MHRSNGWLVGFRAVLAPCALLLTGFGVQAQTALSQDAAVSPKRAQKVGDVRHYRLMLTIRSKRAEGEHVVLVAEKFRTTTKEVQKDGSFSLLDEFESGTATVSGKEINILPLLPAVTITRSAEGRFAAMAEKGNVEGNPEAIGVLQQLAAAADNFLPTRATKTGDRWKIAYANANRMLGSAKLSGDAELTGVEHRGEGETYNIKFHVEDNGNAQDPSHSEGSLTWGREKGMVRFVQKGHGTFAGGPAEVELQVTLEEPTDLKPEKAKQP